MCKTANFMPFAPRINQGAQLQLVDRVSLVGSQSHPALADPYEQYFLYILLYWRHFAWNRHLNYAQNLRIGWRGGSSEKFSIYSWFALDERALHIFFSRWRTFWTPSNRSFTIPKPFKYLLNSKSKNFPSFLHAKMRRLRDIQRFSGCVCQFSIISLKNSSSHCKHHKNIRINHYAKIQGRLHYATDLREAQRVWKTHKPEHDGRTISRDLALSGDTPPFSLNLYSVYY
jgi:hypothetical protein